MTASGVPVPGRHREAAAPAPSRSRSLRRVREITDGYLGRSSRLMVIVVLMSVFTAAAQALALIVVAATGVAAAAQSRRVPLSFGPIDTSVSVGAASLIGVACAVVMIVVQVMASQLSAHLAAKAETECRRRLVDAYLDASWGAVAQRERGEFQQVMVTNVSRVARSITFRGMYLFGVTSLVVMLGAGIATAPLVALIMIAVGAILVSVLQPLKRRTQRAAASHGLAENDIATFSAAMVEQAREARVFNVGEALSDRASALSRRAAGHQGRLQFLLLSTPAVYIGTSLIAISVGVGLLSRVSTAQVASISGLIVLFLRAVGFGQMLVMSIQTLAEAAPYLEALEDEIAAYRAVRAIQGDVDPGPIETLRMRGLGYTYPGSGKPALRDVDLDIDRGEAIGIVGATGSGKSTLAEVILRLRPPTTGSYEVNATPDPAISRAAWSRQVGYVPQQPVIVAGTIRDNIRYFRPWITDARVEQAARDAHIHDEIMRMPDGYDTAVSGLSVGLSGGQRQRICIARALADNARLLVMDEPTSGLDVHSERLFIETIERLKGGTTLVVIAHRLDTIAMCDRVVVVGDGRIERIGPPGAVLDADGFTSRTRVSPPTAVLPST